MVSISTNTNESIILQISQIREKNEENVLFVRMFNKMNCYHRLLPAINDGGLLHSPLKTG
jgi:hypothetical protein